MTRQSTLGAASLGLLLTGLWVPADELPITGGQVVLTGAAGLAALAGGAALVIAGRRRSTTQGRAA